MEAIDFLKKYEGFTPVAIWDVNAYRIGYGSDTITLPSGEVKKVLQNDTTTIADANRDLNRRIEQEFIPKIKSKIGSSNWSKLAAGTQTALISLAYNYGSITKTAIINAIKANDIKNLPKIWIDSTYNDNKSLPEAVRNALRKRRAAESLLITDKKKSLKFALPLILIGAAIIVYYENK